MTQWAESLDLSDADWGLPAVDAAKKIIADLAEEMYQGDAAMEKMAKLAGWALLDELQYQLYRDSLRDTQPVGKQLEFGFVWLDELRRPKCLEL